MIWMLVIAFAGICTGSFGLPMKYTTRWRWEHTWSMWSVWTLLVIPWIIVAFTIPNLFSVYSDAGIKVIGIVFLFGFIWGISAIAFGTGLDYLGLALGYSLMMGLIISIGSLFPLLISQSESVSRQSILVVIIGVVLIVTGLALNAWSAIIKEKDLSKSTSQEKHVPKPLMKGIVICVVAGITAPMLNFAFIYGDQLRVSAEKFGASQTMAPNSIWTITFLSGFLVNLIYCLWLVKRNKAWSLYKEKGTSIYYLYTFIMGLLWAGSIFIYGMATANLGELGPSIGWASFNAIGILWANILGILTGEWKNVGKKGLSVMAIGLLVLLGGVFIVGWANAL